MYKALVFFSIFLATHYQLSAQIYPKENSKLNYRLIGFSYPPLPEVSNYTIQIAEGNYNTDDSFEKNIINTINTQKNKVIIEVPSFGKEYTWRSITGTTTSAKKHTQLHHFSTTMSPAVDTNLTRLRILEKAEKYKDAYVFIDGTNVMYDMQGNPIWYMPDIEIADQGIIHSRDLKLTPQGTITLLTQQNIYEIDYNGKILWKGPGKDEITNSDTINFYHHEFTRLDNGHYMVLEDEHLQWPFSQAKNTDSIKKITPFTSIVEYDEHAKIVWSWKSSRYFKKFSSKTLESYFYNPKDLENGPDVHGNAFYFDQKTKSIYVSFKNLSSVIKVKYPEGEVENVYGILARHDQSETINDFFCGQHSCKISQDGYLYLFNNNTCHPGDLPTVIIMKLPTTQNGDLEKIWEYTLSPDEIVLEKQTSVQSTIKKPIQQKAQQDFSSKYAVGGNVIELPDGSIFTNISGKSSKIYIIGRNKEILWRAVSEKYYIGNKNWSATDIYRASIITDHKDLERLIWNSEKE